jgi:hypothetical protein
MISGISFDLLMKISTRASKHQNKKVKERKKAGKVALDKGQPYLGKSEEKKQEKEQLMRQIMIWIKQSRNVL